MRIPLLWRLAPATLLRFPRSAAAVAFSAAVLVMATVLGPLFLESSQGASLGAELQRVGRFSAGIQIVHLPLSLPSTLAEKERVADLGNAVREILEDRIEPLRHVLGHPLTTQIGALTVASSDEGTSTVRLLARTDALANVTPVEGDPGRDPGDGVWIADATAEALGLGPGDTVALSSGRRRVELAVAGVYRFLPRDTPRAYWTPLEDFIYKTTSDDTFPAAFLIGEGDAFVDLMTSLNPSTQTRWEIPLASNDIDPDAARVAVREFGNITAESLSGSAPLGKTLSELGGNAFDPRTDTLLPGILGTAEQRLETSRAPASVLTVAARALGAGLMVAAGLSLVARRRSEMRALIARGSGPWALGARFAVEGLLPVAAGGVSGLVAGYLGVRFLGPSAVPWSDAISLSGDAALASTAALALLGLSTGGAVAREERSFGDRSVVLRRLGIAGAAAVVAVGALAYRSLGEVSLEGSKTLGGSVLVAPIGVIVAAALVAGAVLRAVLGPAAAAARRRSPGLFLAAKRLASGSGMTHALVIVCGSSLGVMFFGLAVAGSVHTTATAKAKTYVGSDVAAVVSQNPPPLPALPVPATRVAVVEPAYLEGTTQGVTLLGVNTETFERAVFWDESFAADDLADLVARLEEPAEGIPVIAAGFPAGAGVELTGVDVSLEVVGRAASFPGTRARQPLLAMTRDGLTEVIRSGGGFTPAEQIWARGQPRAVEAALRENGVPFHTILTAQEVLGTPIIQSLLWSLGLLGAVGALSSGAAVVGLSLYLQARHTAAQVAAAMTRRMGMPRRQERLSWAVEIGGAGAASLLVGLGTGLATAALVNDRLDIQPDLSPDPVFVVPFLAIAAVSVTVGLVTAFTARRLQVRMDKTSVAEIMRV